MYRKRRGLSSLPVSSSKPSVHHGFLQGTGEYFFLDLTRHDTYAVDVADQDISVIDPYAFLSIGTR